MGLVNLKTIVQRLTSKLNDLDTETGQLSIEVGNVEISLTPNTMELTGNTPISLPSNTSSIDVIVYNDNNIARGISLHIETDVIESTEVSHTVSGGYYINSGNYCTARATIKKLTDGTFELYILYSGLNGTDNTATSTGKATYKVALPTE